MRRRHVVPYLLLALGILATGRSVGAQQLGTTVAVQSFAPAADPVALCVSEIVRNGIARESLIRVVDADGANREQGEAPGLGTLKTATETDYLLEGAVLQSEARIAVSFKLVELATGRTLLAKVVDCESDRLYETARSLAAEVGNSIAATFFGSTAESLETLLSLGRFDEAARRLESFAGRNPDDPRLSSFRERVALGRAREWRARAESEYETARRTENQEAFRASMDAREALHFAIGLIPAGPEHDAERVEYAAFLEKHILPLIRNQADARRRDVEEAAALGLKAGKPAEALRFIADYLELEGGANASKELLALREAAIRDEARQDAARARAESAEGRQDFADMLVRRSLAAAPEDPVVLAAMEKISADMARLENENRRRILIGNDPFSLAGRSSVTLSVDGFIRAFGSGNLEYPLSGALSGVSAELRGYATVAEPLRLFWSASVSYAGTSGATTTQGYSGELGQTLASGLLGAGVSFVRGHGVASAGLFVGGGITSYEGAYDVGGETEALAMRDFVLDSAALVSFEYHLIKGFALRASAGPAALAVFRYGFVNSFRFSLGAELAL